MQSIQYLDALQEHFLLEWQEVATSRKLTIAAVAGYALGGGCELPQPLFPTQPVQSARVLSFLAQPMLKYPPIPSQVQCDGRLARQRASPTAFVKASRAWRELLLNLKRCGLVWAPDLAVGDGALGFWAALREVFGATGEQRC